MSELWDSIVNYLTENPYEASFRDSLEDFHDVIKAGKADDSFNSVLKRCNRTYNSVASWRGACDAITGIDHVLKMNAEGLCDEITSKILNPGPISVPTQLKKEVFSR